MESNPITADDRARFRRHAAIKERESEKRVRRRIRRGLLQMHPYCCHCSGRLTEESACLAVDRLSCPAHTNIVRAYALVESPESSIDEWPAAEIELAAA